MEDRLDSLAIRKMPPFTSTCLQFPLLQGLTDDNGHILLRVEDYQTFAPKRRTRELLFLTSCQESLGSPQVYNESCRGETVTCSPSGGPKRK